MVHEIPRLARQWKPARFAEERRLLSSLPPATIPATPSAGSPELAVVSPGSARSMRAIEFVKTMKKVPESPPGRPIHVEQRFLVGRPRVSLSAEGVLKVSFGTLRRYGGASLFLGTVPPNPKLGLPRYRKQAKPIGPSPAKATIGHRGFFTGRLEYDIRDLLLPKYAHDDLREHGRGTVAWRIEVYDIEWGAMRMFERASSIRCEPAPCSSESKLILLPSFTHTPVVDLPGQDSMVVSFETDAATRARVVVADNAGRIQRIDSKQIGTRHEVEVSGLSADTRYSYYVFVMDHRGEVSNSRGASFRTAPRSDAPVKFVLMSDSRSGHGSGEERYGGTNMRVLRALLGQTGRFGTDFIVFAGDLIDGLQSSAPSFRFELERWRQTVEPWASSTPIFEGMGNHEQLIDAREPRWALPRDSSSARAEEIFAEQFVNPKNGPTPGLEGAPPFVENTYSFDYGPVHIASVTSNYWFRSHDALPNHPAGDKGHREGWVPSEVLDWLDQDLDSARKKGAKHLVVFTHEPAFPNGGHAKDGMYWNGKEPHVLAQRDRLVAILSKHRVALLFTGDEHNYSRMRVDEEVTPAAKNPFVQIVSGGAGAPYYQQETQVPWTKKVARFSTRQHFVLIEARGDQMSVRAIDIGGVAFDRVDLPLRE